jgi:lysozyme
VRAADITFAWIKATEGGDFVDARFAENWRASARAGLLRGAYHFFTFCRPGREQAANFIAHVPVEQGALPPVIDLEMGGNCAARPEPSQLAAELDDFLRIVEPHYAQPAILYLTEELHARYSALAAGRALFLREILFEPRWPDGRAWLLWQFHDHGYVDGVDGPVDLNAFAGSLEELRALARPLLRAAPGRLGEQRPESPREPSTRSAALIEARSAPRRALARASP